MLDRCTSLRVNSLFHPTLSSVGRNSKSPQRYALSCRCSISLSGLCFNHHTAIVRCPLSPQRTDEFKRQPLIQHVVETLAQLDSELFAQGSTRQRQVVRHCVSSNCSARVCPTSTAIQIVVLLRQSLDNIDCNTTSQCHPLRNSCSISIVFVALKSSSRGVTATSRADKLKEKPFIQHSFESAPPVYPSLPHEKESKLS